MVDRAKIHSFEDLEAWQESQNLAVLIYKFTKSFPVEEKFGLTNHLRRAGCSISANIAEGFGRLTHKDKLHFYSIAYGSLLEVKSFILLAERLGFTPSETAKRLIDQTISCQKLLNALSASIRARA